MIDVLDLNNQGSKFGYPGALGLQCEVRRGYQTDLTSARISGMSLFGPGVCFRTWAQV